MHDLLKHNHNMYFKSTSHSLQLVETDPPTDPKKMQDPTFPSFSLLYVYFKLLEHFINMLQANLSQ